jgi:hypothetical protein
MAAISRKRIVRGVYMIKHIKEGSKEAFNEAFNE